MPNHRLDLAGTKIGKLTALHPCGITKFGAVIWLCRCDCGATCETRASDLKRRATVGCGCAKSPPNYVDLTGKHFGKLTVLGLHSRNKHSKWVCGCACGNTTIVLASSLTSGNTKSCGCGHIHVDPARRIWKNYAYQSKARNLSFSLTEGQFAALIVQPCFYCGNHPAQRGAFIHKPYKIYETFVYNGLDRTDNSKGYTPDNVVPCCGVCNRNKGKMSSQEFISWVRRVYSHQAVEYVNA